MEYKGNLLKMRAVIGKPINYHLPLSENLIDMNSLIGEHIEIVYQNAIYCIKCGRKTNKSFSQGFCYPCFQTAPETEECVLRPELCQAHEGIARDMEFARSHCLIDHFVYLSVTSGIKVGVTRSTQIPTRWIDQGATSAIIIAKTPNRYIAGLIEVALKAHMADKTNWRNMLRGIATEVNLESERQKCTGLLPIELRQYATEEFMPESLEYPVSNYPMKVVSANLDKNPVLSGRLSGIKGQYLIFDDNQVINIRKYGGYSVILRT